MDVRFAQRRRRRREHRRRCGAGPGCGRHGSRRVETGGNRRARGGRSRPGACSRTPKTHRIRAAGGAGRSGGFCAGTGTGTGIASRGSRAAKDRAAETGRA
ncbi:hypothetical protein MoryE10_25040 [Methylogaea oryzae]|uniref:Uncharacterized protein n=1 Tax=Methylogaea oryzae TaxID=1295382 RepID=A0A8D4VPY3_9GAMM|nr:hypothetical protein MoryE10_25040 [Methylogaea oryzae]